MQSHWRRANRAAAAEGKMQRCEKVLWQMLWGRALHRITDSEAVPGHVQKGGTVSWSVVVQNVHNSTHRAGCAEELPCTDFLCDH